jgi:hypothetical protein
MQKMAGTRRLTGPPLLKDELYWSKGTSVVLGVDGRENAQRFPLRSLARTAIEVPE